MPSTFGFAGFRLCEFSKARSRVAYRAVEVSPAEDRLGDIDSAELREVMHRAADLVADYLEGVEDYPKPVRVQVRFELG